MFCDEIFTNAIALFANFPVLSNFRHGSIFHSIVFSNLNGKEMTLNQR